MCLFRGLTRPGNPIGGQTMLSNPFYEPLFSWLSSHNEHHHAPFTCQNSALPLAKGAAAHCRPSQVEHTTAVTRPSFRTLLNLSGSADLQYLARMPVVRAQYRPRADLRLGERHLKFGA